MGAFVDKLLVPGDRVVMNMSAESREYVGDKYPPDGTQGTFLGRTRSKVYRGRTGLDAYFYKPGIYEMDGCAIIQWDNGSTEVDGWSHEMLDKVEYNRRFNEWHAIQDKPHNYGENEVKVGELPETAFWEEDKVAFVDGHDFSSKSVNRLRVQRIDYARAEGPCYWLEWVNENNSPIGVSTYGYGEDIRLLERGNVWKEVHGEELVFRDLQEELGFEKLMGRFKEVRNPTSNLFVWSLEEVLAAVRDDVADCFSMPKSMFSAERRISATRFDNREKGEKARAETLKEFAVKAA